MTTIQSTNSSYKQLEKIFTRKLESIDDMAILVKSPYPLLTVNKLDDQCRVSEHELTNDEKTACGSTNDNESFFKMSAAAPTFQPQYEFAQNEIESINQSIAKEEASNVHIQPALSMKITNFEFVPTSNNNEI